MKIYVHCLVKNEEKYLWFSVMSVIDYVDKVFIWDTGSSDKTLQIIEEIEKARPGKVYFKEVGDVDINEFTSVRQKMLDETESDWFILVDGDEVWWNESIAKTISIIEENGDKIDAVVSRYYNVIGDIYHYQDERAGHYEINKEKGHLNIRAIRRNIPGLHVSNPYGSEGFFNADNTPIQLSEYKKSELVKERAYLHFTHLKRSSLRNYDRQVIQRTKKFKFELGIPFPVDFYYPEVFFKPKPDIVDSPWTRRDFCYILRAGIELPFRETKRKIVKNRSGY
jgi:glycosyltransferase involved in cell wall biosynthesis